MLSVSRFAVQTDSRKDINAEIMKLPADMAAENASRL